MSTTDAIAWNLGNKSGVLGWRYTGDSQDGDKYGFISGSCVAAVAVTGAKALNKINGIQAGTVDLERKNLTGDELYKVQAYVSKGIGHNF